ncbi:unnamed protein product [Somion occarium]|uniref:F-box domain-containing protein n=1 Tax=Somion occarium TaxID=3059160 RepID=A0ABP1CZU1_9APHY
MDRFSTELLVEVFLHLHVRELILCRCVSRRWNVILTETPSLQLLLACQLSGYKTVRAVTYMPKKFLQLLQKIQDTWRSPVLEPPHLILPIPPHALQPRQFNDIIVSSLRPDSGPAGTMYEGIEVIRLRDGVDPGSHLLILCYNKMGTENQTRFKFYHFLCLSTGLVHPRLQTQFPTSSAHTSVPIKFGYQPSSRVSGDIIVIADRDKIVLLHWPSCTFPITWQPSDEVAYLAALPVRDQYVLLVRLQKRPSRRLFIDVYLLVQLDNPVYADVYRVAIFEFPTLNQSRLGYMQAHFSPHKDHSSQAPSSQSEIYSVPSLVCLFLESSQGRYSFITPLATFLPGEFFPEPRGHATERAEAPIPWQVWGPYSSYLFQSTFSHQDVRHVSGYRVFTSSEIVEFNPFRLRMPTHLVLQGGVQEIPGTLRTYSDGLFTGTVRTYLPYWRVLFDLGRMSVFEDEDGVKVSMVKWDLGGTPEHVEVRSLGMLRKEWCEVNNEKHPSS